MERACNLYLCVLWTAMKPVKKTYKFFGYDAGWNANIDTDRYNPRWTPDTKTYLLCKNLFLA